VIRSLSTIAKIPFAQLCLPVVVWPAWAAYL